MKTYNIQFGGHIMAQIIVDNDNISINGCIDGYGNAMPKDDIVIVEQNED